MASLTPSQLFWRGSILAFHDPIRSRRWGVHQESLTRLGWTRPDGDIFPDQRLADGPPLLAAQAGLPAGDGGGQSVDSLASEKKGLIFFGEPPRYLA